MVSLHYTLTKEDYVNFYTYVTWDAGDRRKKRAKSIIKQVGFVLLFIAVYYIVGGFRYLSRSSALIILLMFATSFIPLIGGRSGADRDAEEIADDPENATVFTSTSLTASESGLFVKTSFAENRYNWQAIVRRTETKNYFFLFLNSMQALIIPKKAFESEQELNIFKKLLSGHLTLDADIKDDIINAGE